MGRTFLVEESAQKIIEAHFSKKQPCVGIIVGQQTQQQKDYVVHAVCTPEEEGTKPTLDSIDESWVANHAKQVQCMMPGGLNVIGIFAVGMPDDMKSAPTKLRQILFAVYKTLVKLQIIPIDNEVPDKIVLQLCSLTTKITCRTYDVYDQKSTAKPADWKYQSFFDRWIKLTTNVTVDFSIPVTSDMGQKSLKKQIQIGITPTCEEIMSSLALLNGKMYSDDQPLDNISHSAKKKKQPKGDKDKVLHYEVDLFSQMTRKGDTKPPAVTECCAKMYVRGTMCCRAFMHNKTHAKEAIQALKHDCVMTLQRRCELLCEDMLLDEEEQDPRILYETPRRVYAGLAGTPLDLCDYVFVEEMAAEVSARVNELLGCHILQDDITMDCEKLPEDTELMKPDNSALIQNTESITRTKPRKSTPQFVGMFLGGAIAAVVAGLSYMYMGDS